MQLSELYVYPVKAMKGIALQTAKLEERGIWLDRRWMLVDENSRFISQRQIPELALFKVEIQESQLKVTFQNDHVFIPFDEKMYLRETSVTIWKDRVNGLIAPEAINTWFSERLGKPCKLSYQGESSVRMTSSKYAPSQQVSFADGYPFLVISEESLDFLNSKLQNPVEMNRFRPNLVIKGGAPHIEDQYHNFKIGDTLFKGVKPCARCNVTTIDQSNGQEGIEPLKTLGTYRRDGRKILFGQNLLLQKDTPSTIINIGDKVELSDKKIKDD